MKHADRNHRGRLRRLGLTMLVAALAAGLAPGAAEAAKKNKKEQKKQEQVIRVMTRNLYLGADLTPGLQAPNINAFIDAAGEISDQVERTNFPLRSQALADEILTQKPDLVGLQEVALWRTGPLLDPADATTVKYDFLQLLMDRLNAGKKRYAVQVVKDEFDFESPSNDGSGGLAAANRDERLTMRDVIISRVGSGIKVFNRQSATFPVLMRVTVGGAVSINVTRGWTSVDAKVRWSKKFHFINLHFEAFDSGPANETNLGTTVGQGGIREAQAQSLFAPQGPATSPLRTILVGDLNSDDDTVGGDGDVLAYNALVAGGFRPVDTSNPLSCCLDDPNLVVGTLAEFDHHIDHVMTNAPKQVKFLQGFVTGRGPVNGLWPSDHNGVTSKLRVPPRKMCKKGKKKAGKKAGKNAGCKKQGKKKK